MRFNEVERASLTNLLSKEFKSEKQKQREIKNMFRRFRLIRKLDQQRQ